MTSQFDNFEHDKLKTDKTRSNPMSSELNNNAAKSSSELDRFELVSAYIDGELSAAERKRVQAWIDREPEMKTLYTNLLALQGQMQSLEAPASKSADKITEGVFKSLDRRRHQRRLMLGGSAIAASVLATITGLIPGVAPAWRSARNAPAQNPADTVMLAVALNKPTIDIPKPLNGYNVEQQLLPDRL